MLITWRRCRSHHLLAAAVLLPVSLTGCPFPDQNTLPPSVRVTYWLNNNIIGAVDQTVGLPPQSIDPSQPVTITADGWSSLKGMQSLELDGEYEYTCSDGNVATQSNGLLAPQVQQAGSFTLHLSGPEFDLGPPRQNCSDLPFSNWSATFTATATSLNGLSATTQLLTLRSP